MATYKSGDIVGVWETWHNEGGPFAPYKVYETYTWRIRYIERFKIWILTASTTLDVWGGHEIVQSATYINSWKEHLNPDFLASNYVNLLANNEILGIAGLKNEDQLGDDYIRDNTTLMPDPGPNGTNTLTNTNTSTSSQSTSLTSKINSTYLLIGAIVIVIALILAKRK